MVCGMLVMRVPEQRPAPLLFARVHFFADFVTFSTPMPSSRRGPTDKYDGETHKRNFCGRTPTRRRTAPVSLSTTLAVLKRIVFALVILFSGSRSGMPA